MRIHFQFVALLAITLSPSCGNAQNTAPATPPAATQQNTPPPAAATLPAAQFKQALADRPGTLVDVRTPDEWQEGVIAGAKLIDFHSADFAGQVGALDKSKPVYLYCAAGGRSYKAMQQLIKLGFTDVHDLEGGMGGWQDAGYTTVPPDSTGKR